MKQDGLIRLSETPGNSQPKLIETTKQGEDAFQEILAVNDKFYRKLEAKIQQQDVELVCRSSKEIQALLDSVLWEEASTGEGQRI